MKDHSDGQDQERTPRAAPARSDEAAAEAPDTARRAPSARPFSVSTAQRLQSGAGNRALTGLLAQRRATTTAAPTTDASTPIQDGEQSADVVHESDTTRTTVLSL